MEPDRKIALKGAKLIKNRKKFLKLSALVPGLGQFVSGRKITGFAFFSTFAFPFYFLAKLHPQVNYGSLTLIGSQVFLYFLQLYDAIKGSKRETSPCEDFCPAKVKIPTFMALCEAGKFEEAFGAFYLSSPFPFTLGELCPAPCEEKCGILPERPLRIREVHREMAKIVLGKIEVRKREPFFPKVNKRVAIVGGGIAGLTAAYYLSSAGISVDIFEKEGKLGGLINLIPDFKFNKEIVKKEIAFVTSFKNIRVFTHSEVKEKIEGYDAVILAIGAQKEKRINVGSFKGKVIYPLEFLKNTPPLKGKKVAVVGAGNTAFDVARLSARKGAEVVVLYRGDASNIKVRRKELNEAVKEGIKIFTNCNLKGSSGEKIVFSCGEFSPDYLVPAVGFEVERELVSRLKGKNTFLVGDALNGMSSLVEASMSGREVAYRLLKKFGLSDRAWFSVDFYEPKPERPSGENLFVVSESSLCQHCGIKVKS